MPAHELGALVVRDLVARTGIDPGTVDDVIFAQCYALDAPALGRVVALDAGLPVEVAVPAGGQLIGVAGAARGSRSALGRRHRRVDPRHAAREMHRRGARCGLETMCIGGGHGLAAAFERV